MRVGFKLSEDFPEEGEAEVLFENRTIRYSKRRLVDSYAPHERHVYRIRVGGKGASTTN